jgi:hypothetical protein
VVHDAHLVGLAVAHTDALDEGGALIRALRAGGMCCAAGR